MKNRKVFIIAGIVLLATILIFATAASRRGIKPETVKTTVASKGDIKAFLSTNAIIKSKNSKSFTGMPQLPVKTVRVKVGDSVSDGETMLEYDVADMNTSVAQARIQHNNAILQRKELANQKKQLEETIARLDRDIKQLEESTDPSDLLQLQTLRQKRESLQPVSNERLKLADNAVSLAKLALDSAVDKLNKYKSGIVAEFDGIVTAVNAVEGTSLNPAQPAVVVQQLENLKAVLSLGKYDAAKVKPGQEAVVKSGGKTYKGKVAFVSPAAEKTVSMAGQDTSLQAEVDILDESPDLKVDFDANVDILLGNAQDVVKIPVESVKHDKTGRSYAFRIVDQKADQTELKLGLQSDTEVQVVEGLSPGDTVIVNPSIAIRDEVAVKVASSEEK
jgi:HlyD family secretion protein